MNSGFTAHKNQMRTLLPYFTRTTSFFIKQAEKQTYFEINLTFWVSILRSDPIIESNSTFPYKVSK